MPFIGNALALACGTERLTGTTACPNRSRIVPTCESECSGPSTDTREEVALCITFEVTGGDIDRKFTAPPAPGETKVLHVTLKRGAHYTIYSTNTDDGKRTKKMTLNVK